MTRARALVAAVALLGPGAVAQVPADPRVRTVLYVPDQVTTLSALPGYVTLVELAPDERIESLVVGNAAAWQLGERVVEPAQAGGQLAHGGDGSG